MTEEFKWDPWQLEAINYKGSITVRAGRQVGKSTAIGKRRSKQMLEYPGSKSLIIAPAQRQSSELFTKTRSWLEVENEKLLKEAGGWKADPKLSAKRNLELRRRFEYDHGIYNELPTKTTIVLKKDFYKPQSPSNAGSVLYSLPAGKTGIYLRTYALDFLDIDEAAYVPESVYTALKPMLAVSAKTKGLGWETLLSTPFGKGGFFYHSHHSPDYRQFHISSEDCPRIGKDFLRKEKQRLTKAEYAQEWKGEFTDEWNQFFPTELIKKCMTIMDWSLKEDRKAGSKLYLGVDIARYGGDENAFVIAELHRKSDVRIVKVFTTDRVSTTDTIGRIQKIDSLYHFSRIFVDDGGIGGAVTDILIDRLGRRVMGLNNASKRIQVKDEEKKKGILKEDLYSNTLMLMETGKLELVNDLKLLKSMKSITFEYGEMKGSSKVKIFGDYSHITEALVRACWCVKERGLRMYMC
jgi:hypothetical protein